MDNQRWSAYQSDYSTNPTINSGLPPPYPAPNSIPASSYQVGNEQRWRTLPRQNGLHGVGKCIVFTIVGIHIIFAVAFLGFFLYIIFNLVFLGRHPF